MLSLLTSFDGYLPEPEPDPNSQIEFRKSSSDIFPIELPLGKSISSYLSRDSASTCMPFSPYIRILEIRNAP